LVATATSLDGRQKLTSDRSSTTTVSSANPANSTRVDHVDVETTGPTEIVKNVKQRQNTSPPAGANRQLKIWGDRSGAWSAVDRHLVHGCSSRRISCPGSVAAAAAGRRHGGDEILRVAGW